MARRQIIELSSVFRQSIINNICYKASSIGKEVLIDRHYADIPKEKREALIAAGADPAKKVVIRNYIVYSLNFPECDLFVRNWYAGNATPLLEIIENVDKENILKDIHVV